MKNKEKRKKDLMKVKKMKNKEKRKKRKIKKIKNHVEWLYTMHKAGVQLNPDKIQDKIIIDKLVSKENKK